MNIKTLAITACAAVFSLSACGGTNKEVAYETVVDGATSSVRGGVEKTLKLSGFDGITASWPVEIHYTQGSGYKVVAHGSEEAFARVAISVADGKLSVKQRKNDDYGDDVCNECTITLYVTSPSLSSVKNSTRMNFTAQYLDTDGLSVINNGVLVFKIEKLLGKGSSSAFGITNNGRMDANVPSVDAAKLSIVNNGVIAVKGGSLKSGVFKMVNHGRMDFSGDVKGGSVECSNSGVNAMKGTFSIDGDYEYVCYGRSDFDGDVAASSISMHNSGVDTWRGGLKADNLSVKVSGRSDYDMSFAGGKAELECNGIGTFNLSLDCQSVAAIASGRIEVTLSGTADNTEFTGSGVSHIDTSGLNKF